jgi:hypothetical protein
VGLVSYEGLVQNPEMSLSHLSDFLGMPLALGLEPAASPVGNPFATEVSSATQVVGSHVGRYRLKLTEAEILRIEDDMAAEIAFCGSAAAINR